jgi:hypothetical protein
MSNELYDIRLPDGSLVQWTAQQIADYEDDWQMYLSVRDAKVVEDNEADGELALEGFSQILY